MTAYIKEAAVISPQHTFGTGFPDKPDESGEVNYLKCVEPPYRDFIDPMVARRMSRIVKMGVCSALKCLKNNETDMPDAIIAGTGLGCLEDTDRFLTSIYTNNEKLLNPTPFIQSTHNTVAGAIALAIKCHGYNATYTHRGFSFESALEDALLQLSENPHLNILTGGFDELTENSYAITRRLGLWKNHPVSNSELLKYNDRGSLPGEGAAFFMLSGHKDNHAVAVLRSLKTFYRPKDSEAIQEIVLEFLKNADKDLREIDLVMLGINGDQKTDRVYYDLGKNMFAQTPCATYKFLCGEYDTSASFALWLASLAIKQQKVPGYLIMGKAIPGKINNVLIYNHLRGINHSLYLLEQC